MFILDEKKLEPFDILLVRFPNDETSLKIRETCNSNYSHAIIYLGNSSFIEGIEPIVSLFSYHRYYFPNLDNAKMLRLNANAKSKLNSIETENALRRLSYCNYSKRLLYFINQKKISENIIKFFFENKVWQGGIVCTSLITLPYYAGGIDISKKKEPFYAHFADIENYEGFIDVTNDVFKQIDDKEINNETFDYFTTYKTDSLLEKQSEIVTDLNSYIQNKYMDILNHSEKYQDIHIIKENLGFSSWEDIFPNIMRWFLTDTGKAIDNELSNLILSKGYHMLWFEEIHKHKEQFFPFYYYPFTKWKKQDLEFLKNTLQGTYDRMQVSEEATFQNFTLCPCKTFHILLDMYRSFSDLLRSSINQYDALIKMQNRR
jgi:hypothetical protein